jgi:hypothetical protein
VASIAAVIPDWYLEGTSVAATVVLDPAPGDTVVGGVVVLELLLQAAATSASDTRAAPSTQFPAPYRSILIETSFVTASLPTVARRLQQTGGTRLLIHPATIHRGIGAT